MLPTCCDDRPGLDAMAEPVLREVVSAVRSEIWQTRENLHRLCCVRRCDMQLQVGGAHRLLITGECLCRDFLQDMLTEADRFLVHHADPVLNPPGAVRKHVRTRAYDWFRQMRAERGTQVRTDRIRDGAIAALLPDPHHRALLEFVVQEAGSLAPLGNEAELHRRLAGLIAAEFGGTVEENLRRVVEGLPRIEAAARSVRRVRAAPGSDELVTWWERYVERPLGRRQRLDSVPWEPADSDLWPRLVEPDPGGAAVGILLEIGARRADAPRVLALREAVDRMVCSELLPEADARRFLGNPRRVREAVALLDVLWSGTQEPLEAG